VSTPMRRIINSITQRWQLQALCVLCQQYHRGRFAVCEPCHTLITPLGPACRHCAEPLPDAAFLVCGRCCQKKPWVDSVFTAYRFEEPLRTLMHEFKYRQGLHLSSYFSQLMLNALPSDLYKTDCLVPVPMHPKRIRQRGFNQSAVLTKQLSRALKLPFSLSYCRKMTNTAPQASLNATERKKNLRGVFQAKQGSYQHITLIDDLLTTGSTANELAKTLKAQGVQQVNLWCCARVTGGYYQSLSEGLHDLSHE
jgi:ComF family protein